MKLSDGLESSATVVPVNVTLPATNYIPRVSLEGSGTSGIWAAWDQPTKWEQQG